MTVNESSIEERMQDVLVVRGSTQRSCALRWCELSYRSFEMSLDGPEGRIEVHGSDLFHALELVRAQLEPHGWLVAVQGSRANAWASGMQRDMNGARRVYLWERGKQFDHADLVKIVAPADPADLVTVEVQRQNYTSWRESVRGEHPTRD